jgi:adenine-specific DNA-methyltransferase
MAASLTPNLIAQWGGAVVVENHVNVLTSLNPASALTPEILSALLDSAALDRLYRCLTGSVAVSAYELAALPMPGPQVLQQWTCLGSDALSKEIEAVYGL